MYHELSTRNTIFSVRSLRLDPDLDTRVCRAAAREGQSVSEFLRRAAADRADRVLAERPSDQLRGVIGAVRSEGGRAARTGAAFGEALAETPRRR
jgi:hypothetical protein